MKKIKKAPNKANTLSLRTIKVAGVQGLEPWARGFGALVRGF